MFVANIVYRLLLIYHMVQNQPIKFIQCITQPFLKSSESKCEKVKRIQSQRIKTPQNVWGRAHCIIQDKILDATLLCV